MLLISCLWLYHVQVVRGRSTMGINGYCAINTQNIISSAEYWYDRLQFCHVIRYKLLTADETKKKRYIFAEYSIKIWIYFHAIFCKNVTLFFDAVWCKYDSSIGNQNLQYWYSASEIIFCMFYCKITPNIDELMSLLSWHTVGYFYKFAKLFNHNYDVHIIS